MRLQRIDESVVKSLDFTTALEKKAQRHARALVACGDGYVPSTADYVQPGANFVIDILIPEGVPSGDGRTFELNSITKKDGPLELLWQQFSQKGHDGAVIVGRIDSVERLESLDSYVVIDGITHGWGRARGVFDNGPYGREAERLVRGGFLRGVSADMDMFEAAMELAAEDDEEKDGIIKNDPMTISKARLIAATLVSKPAFQGQGIRIEEPYFEFEYAELPIEDGMYEEELEDVFAMSAALAASAAPVVPPKDWFSNPRLNGPTPITVTDDGKVFGHIAAWNVDHIGLPRATKPPRSRSNYAYFRTGVLRVDDGTDVPVGQLTLAGGHAPLQASAEDAVKHYDDTASAVADVSAGEDQFGIWVAGALRPEVSPSQVRALRASAPSGDWRPINGRLELVAVCQVNVPGFPVARSMVAGGHMVALVAAGARPLAELREKSLEERLAALENKEVEKEFSNKLAEADSVFLDLMNERQEALAASAKPAMEFLDALADEDEKERQAMVASMKAILDALE
jgi:hypothetical protein